MPANLPPEYIRLEGLLREAKTPEEKLPILREMLAVIPKHKGTEKMQADLKRRISKLQEAAEQRRRAGGRADPFHVPREGAGQVVLAGPPNVGKSSLLAALTEAHPVVAEYPFSTHQPQPGMVPFEDVQIQLVDAPPLVLESLPPGIINLYRNADLILLVVDLAAEDPAEQARAVLKLLSDRLVDVVARREEGVDPGQVSRVRKRGLVVANKRDLAPGPEPLEALRRAVEPLEVVAVSCSTGEGLERLPGLLFQGLERIRVYTKKPGYKFEPSAPYVLPLGSTVVDAAREIHRDFAERLKFARIWGSAKHDGAAVPRDHVLQDKDIVEFHV
jgi:hypothetical protein